MMIKSRRLQVSTQGREESVTSCSSWQVGSAPAASLLSRALRVPQSHESTACLRSPLPRPLSRVRRDETRPSRGSPPTPPRATIASPPERFNRMPRDTRDKWMRAVLAKQPASRPRRARSLTRSTMRARHPTLSPFQSARTKASPPPAASPRARPSPHPPSRSCRPGTR